MKKLVLAGLFSVLLFSGFSYADNMAADPGTINLHAAHHHAHVISKAQSRAPVDINHANESDLSTLKGIGPKKAKAIIAYRDANGPFKSAEDLAHVKGIGEKSVTRLQANNLGRIVVGGVQESAKKY